MDVSKGSRSASAYIARKYPYQGESPGPVIVGRRARNLLASASLHTLKQWQTGGSRSRAANPVGSGSVIEMALAGHAIKGKRDAETRTPMTIFAVVRRAARVHTEHREAPSHCGARRHPCVAVATWL